MGSDPQEMLAAAHHATQRPIVTSSFEKSWKSLIQQSPNSFTPSDRRIAKLFYDIGITDMLQSINEVSKLLVAHRDQT
jgi:hypothetical protein